MSKDDLVGKEPHPACETARAYYNSISLVRLEQLREAFASCAIEDNRLGEICLGTMNRLSSGNKVSDRYFLGLVWAIRDLEEPRQKGTTNE